MADRPDTWDNGPTAEAMAPGFYLPSGDAPSHQLQHQDPPPPPPPPMTMVPRLAIMKKATKHRKRHIPVGPAGVLFQQTLQQQQSSKRQQQHANGCRNEEAAAPRSHLNADDNDTEGGDYDSSSGYSPTRPYNNHHSNRHDGSYGRGGRADMSAYMSPAWTAAQCALQLSTPSCLFHWTTVQKYTALRPHYPEPYLLLPEVLAGEADWKMRPSQKLLVQVVTVQAGMGAGDHTWTACLTDETGACLTAWMEPAWVCREQQQQQYIRPGCLWLLQNCTLQLVLRAAQNNQDPYHHHGGYDEYDEDNSNLDRLLLVGPDNVERAWNGSTSISNTEYIGWMEERSEKTMQLAVASTGSSSSSSNESAAQQLEDNGGRRERDDYFAPSPPRNQNPVVFPVQPPPPPQGNAAPSWLQASRSHHNRASPKTFAQKYRNWDEYLYTEP